MRDGPDVGTFVNIGSDEVERIFGYKKLWLDGDEYPYMTVVYATPRARVTGVPRAITRRKMAGLSLAAAASWCWRWSLSQFSVRAGGFPASAPWSSASRKGN
jgi:hypothetical protein